MAWSTECSPGIVFYASSRSWHRPEEYSDDGASDEYDDHRPGTAVSDIRNDHESSPTRLRERSWPNAMPSPPSESE
ncbi:hypothetical protein HYPSUDRAFT_206396 [Hypholoma sublateritium FD-334 SS-4]|uniref:Uncharacterized protein n=1 Tax=Hypholoma sublateritium (strain FD-334 SS-4) TaxID=945553 RepID=A0A0D2NDW7_HYPSF|nr:hypothetical protein HYPSUDRAFT_206396 [Hypholoma sublateritium FD-334 SS-4]